MFVPKIKSQLLKHFYRTLRVQSQFRPEQLTHPPVPMVACGAFLCIGPIPSQPGDVLKCLTEGHPQASMEQIQKLC